MIPLIHCSVYDNSELLNQILKQYQDINTIGYVFEISHIKSLNRDVLKEKLKTFNEIKTQLLKSKKISIYFILKINIKQLKFNNKQITEIKSLCDQVDFSMINSYSNEMVQQLTSKKYCNMIVNVFSQELVKRFDFIHHFNSGLNHVIVQDMNQKGIALGVDLIGVSNLSSLSLAKFFSSCIQNSNLCSKGKVAQVCFNVIKELSDVRLEKDYLMIQKSMFKATPFMIKNQKEYFDNYFDVLDRSFRGEIVGF